MSLRMACAGASTTGPSRGAMSPLRTCLSCTFCEPPLLFSSKRNRTYTLTSTPRMSGLRCPPSRRGPAIPSTGEEGPPVNSQTSPKSSADMDTSTDPTPSSVAPSSTDIPSAPTKSNGVEAPVDLGPVPTAAERYRYEAVLGVAMPVTVLRHKFQCLSAFLSTFADKPHVSVNEVLDDLPAALIEPVVTLSAPIPSRSLCVSHVMICTRRDQ